MKHQYHEVMSEFIRKEILETVSILNLSNEVASEKLGITSRNYSYFKAGKYSCSISTMGAYLANMCPDKAEFLERLEKAIKEAESKL